MRYHIPQAGLRFQLGATLFVAILWWLDVSAWLTPYITPLSQCIILAFYLRAQAKWNYRGRITYREENWVLKTYSRMSFKSVWFFPIWLLFCWLASENTWYLISLLYLGQLVIGLSFPRIEYRMTKDTPEGWALREYAQAEFDEDKMEQRFYTQIYQPHLRYKKHEYYLWWQMQGERWIFRIKAFSQFNRDIIACIIVLVAAFVGLIYMFFIDISGAKFNPEHIDFFYIIYPIGYVIVIAYLSLGDDYSHRYHAWNYFFYYDRYREAAGPRKENPGTWEYYYYIVRGIFPKKYRRLQDEQDRQARQAAGQILDDRETEAEEEGADDLIGSSRIDLNDYDATGGEDRSDDFIEFGESKQVYDDDTPDRSAEEERQDMERANALAYAAQKKRKLYEKRLVDLKKKLKNIQGEIAQLEKEQPIMDNAQRMKELKKAHERIEAEITKLEGELFWL